MPMDQSDCGLSDDMAGMVAEVGTRSSSRLIWIQVHPILKGNGTAIPAIILRHRRIRPEAGGRRFWNSSLREDLLARKKDPVAALISE